MAAHSILEVFEGNPQPFKMLIVGETGSGKTSFLNLLYNCDRVQQSGRKFDEDGMKHFQQFNDGSLENDQKQKMQSKTSGTKMYTIRFRNIQVGIIDTPGFGDSRGFKQDEANVKTIIDVLREQNYINCVCVVINGRTPRITVTLKYVLTEITSMMPKTILNNVIVVFTNSKDPLYVNFDPEQLSSYFGRQPEHIFYTDNPYAIYQKIKDEGRRVTSTAAASLRREFEHAASVLKEMCEAIHGFPPVHTRSFTELYEKKQAIEGAVLKLLTEYDNQVRFEKELKIVKEKLVAAQRTKTLNKDFKTDPIPFYSPYPTPYHNTLCNFKDCHSNCHEHCRLPKSIEKNVFKGCKCMGSGDICTKCHHSYEYHYHGYELYKLEKKVAPIDEEMRKKFLDAKNQEEQMRVLRDGIKEKLAKTEHERKRLAEELFQQISEFQKLGVLRNYRQLVENQLAVIDTRIKGTEGDELVHLRKTREDLAKKLLQLQPI